ncbi:MAG: VOC family protein [Thermoplasmata archaeon]
MKRVTGIGGIFFKSADPEELVAWYQEHLGIQTREDGSIDFEWRERNAPREVGYTVWAPFREDATYFDPSEKPFMINFRVADLDSFLRQLRDEGVTVDDRVEDTPYGRFGWIMDPEGHRVELWEPAPKLDSGSPASHPGSSSMAVDWGWMPWPIRTCGHDIGVSSGSTQLRGPSM